MTESLPTQGERSCTCHPGEAPPTCMRKYALADCRLAYGDLLREVDPGSVSALSKGERIGPFVLVTDDSGHYYVIPVSHEGEWDRWVGSPAWADGEVPKFAEAVGGAPSLVQFREYIIT